MLQAADFVFIPFKRYFVKTAALGSWYAGRGKQRQKQAVIIRFFNGESAAVKSVLPFIGKRLSLIHISILKSVILGGLESRALLGVKYRYQGRHKRGGVCPAAGSRLTWGLSLIHI